MDKEAWHAAVHGVAELDTNEWLKWTELMIIGLFNKTMPQLVSLVLQLCPTLCDPMDWSTSRPPVLHYLPECSNSCPLSQGCCLTISSSAALFSFCLQSFPASGSFPVSQLFTSGGQSIGASVSVLPMNIQDWFPLRLTGLISLQSKELSRVFSSTNLKAPILRHSSFFRVQLSHP